MSESAKLDAAQSSHDPLIGARVAGRYVIERIHERGGTSTVYAGLHEQQQREVAIKVLDPSAAGEPEAVRRFMYEARTASSLSHGHVVGVSDFGQLPDGRPYLVMPMIAGKDLATVVAEEGPLPPVRVAMLLRGAASALDAMHERGLVHRDIKSENLMHVRGDDGAETALVLDFGIAARREGLDERRDDASGTPEFMAPEALDGEHWDHRADVYSLTTVAFELMTGALPFDGDDLSDLVHKKVTHTARTLAEAAGTSFAPALEGVIAAGLSADPSKRPATAGELIRRLAAAATRSEARNGAGSDSVAPQAGGRRSARYRTLVGTGAGARLGLPFTGNRARSPRRTAPNAHGLAPGQGEAQGQPPVGSPPQTYAPAQGHQDDPDFSAARELTGVRRKLSIARAKLDAARLEATSRHAPQAHDSAWAPESPVAHPSHPPGPSEREPSEKEAHRPPAANAPSQDTRLLFVMPERPRLAPESLSPPPDLDSDLTLELPRRKRVPLAVKAMALVAVCGIAYFAWPRTSSDPEVEGGPSTPSAVAATAPAEPPAPEPPSEPAAPIVAPVADTVAPPAAPPVAHEAVAEAVPAAPAPTEAAVTPPANDPPATKTREPRAPKRAAPRTPRRARAERALDAAPSLQSLAPSETTAEKRERAQALTKEATDAMLRGEFASARAKLDEAIGADPRYAPAHRSKGLLLERMGRSAEAVRAFRAYLRLSPSASDAERIEARISALD